MILSFFVACRVAVPGLGSDPVLPPPRLAPGTVLLREWIPLQVDRSMGKAEAFDVHGCFRQAANTWLWVHDPVLQRAADPWLYLNGTWDEQPWFCLTESQRWRLDRALDSLPLHQERSVSAGTPLAVRFTARVDGRLRSAAVPLGEEARHPDTVELVALLTSLAAEGVWGLSPEESSADGEAALAMDD